MLGQVVVVEMESLLVHESSSKLGISRYPMPRSVLRNACCKCGVECCFVTSQCKIKGYLSGGHHCCMRQLSSVRVCSLVSVQINGNATNS